nr:hypothetical protein Iba_chr08aCG12060 [Ipomoea batatas]
MHRRKNSVSVDSLTEMRTRRMRGRNDTKAVVPPEAERRSSDGFAKKPSPLSPDHLAAMPKLDLAVVHACLRSSDNPLPEGGEEDGRPLEPSLVIAVFSKARCQRRSLIAAPKLLAVDSTTSPERRNQCDRRGKTSMENLQIVIPKRKLNLVTPAIEMAMEVLNRESSPKCPTIITEITCKKYCDKVTATIGPAKYPNLFTTTQIAAHRHQNSLPLSSSIATPPPCLFLISSSLLNKNSLLKL